MPLRCEPLLRIVREASWLGPRIDDEADDLMLVGHLPHLERLAALLVTGNAEHAVVGFPAGGLVALDRTEERWLVSAVRP